MKENFVNYIPLKVYRYLRWKKGERKEYRFNKEHFSEEYAKICRKAVTAQWKGAPKEQILTAYEKKHDYVVQYVENLCGDVIEKYKSGYRPQVREISEERKIWVFWWTGEDTAPDIVKAYIKSIRRNANGHEVVVLDKENYQEYVAFPAYVLEKHKKGWITHAQFSDLLRFTLLSNYGGVWIDATVFLSQQLPNNLFVDLFYTLRTVNNELIYYSKSRWCSYFLAGSRNFPLFSFARDLMLTYWERTDQQVGYLLVDYACGLAYNHLEEVRTTIDSVPNNNFKRIMLMDAINAPYSPELFQILETEETFASKLSWRYGNPKPRTAEGEMTNYGYLLSL